MGWVQKEIRLGARSRGFHLVTAEILQQLPELREFRVGLAHIFIQHTSAALALNENADPTVRQDMERHHRTLREPDHGQPVRGQSLGIELREITERSKIGMSYLQALESEQYAKLPAIVYVRGFLSEYARILGLEARRVIETYLERYRSVRAGTASEEAEEE